MTVNIFSFRITITKREFSLEKALQNEKAIRFFEENRSKVENFMRQY
ncbi:putative protein (TIGR02413 family) OS=Ureibacillus acetophenoni OX=614649 GN=SAMN05877842_11717 PE=4 SV=1 [Ureibacillus acetophenoni]